MTSTSRGKSRLIDAMVVVALLAASGFVVVRTVWSGRHAPVPQVFSAGYTFSQAKSVASESGKPVLVVASADWCGPCQMYKRGALSDERVRAALESTFVPVHVNVDKQTKAAAELNVSYIPLTAVLKDGTVVARYEAPLGTEQLLDLASRFGETAESRVAADGS